MRTRGGIMFFGLIILVLSGCASIGPGTVSRDRFDYNASITESWKRQILLNIVKIRYVEPVSFVDVGQIVAGYSLETGIDAGGSATLSNFNTTASITTGLSGKFTDRPTITYVPMTGNAFIKSLLTPLSPENLMFAIQSGVPADMIFKPTDGALLPRIFMNSSVMRSCEIIESRSLIASIARRVFDSISNPSCAANRIARMMRSGSSSNVFSGSSGV